jgi:integrase
MATTINYYIAPRERKDGTFSVKIRVTHNRVSRYINTSIYITRAQVARDGVHIKDATVEVKVSELLMEMRKTLMGIAYANYMTADQLVDALNSQADRQQAFRLDLFDFAAQQMAAMEPKTAEGYRTALNAVKRFIKKDHIDINEITSAWVRQFREFLETEPQVVGKKGTKYRQKSRGSRAVSYYLGCLRSLHNKARLIYNDDDAGHIVIPRQPFTQKDIVPKMPVTEHRALSVAQVKAVLSAKAKPGSRAELARDVFALSFALAGTNTIDLYNLKTSDLDGILLTYNRAKTDSTRRDHARITLKVIPEAASVIEKYPGRDGFLLSFAQRYANSHEFNRAVNKGLKDVGKLAGIDDIGLQTGHARHSFATIARNVCRIDFDTVNAALNHVHQGTDRIGDIYIARDYTAIWAAQEAVMAEVMKAKAEKVTISAAM